MPQYAGLNNIYKPKLLYLDITAIFRSIDYLYYICTLFWILLRLAFDFDQQ